MALLVRLEKLRIQGVGAREDFMYNTFVIALCLLSCKQRTFLLKHWSSCRPHNSTPLRHALPCHLFTSSHTPPHISHPTLQQNCNLDRHLDGPRQRVHRLAHQETNSQNCVLYRGC
ncbi:hypothetical protein KC19_6G023100 [Ceratodon purpureus]|uniref:Uncharacterized protein n=1 Tax=Ceratodon purpureus TaxID=3225 RepID=A0A8T0HH91_CERPU|nr:hypothetical protein KC19_6G023100 [Ceratodon purpureus]